MELNHESLAGDAGYYFFAVFIHSHRTSGEKCFHLTGLNYWLCSLIGILFLTNIFDIPTTSRISFTVHHLIIIIYFTTFEIVPCASCNKESIFLIGCEE